MGGGVGVGSPAHFRLLRSAQLPRSAVFPRGSQKLSPLPSLCAMPAVVVAPSSMQQAPAALILGEVRHFYKGGPLMLFMVLPVQPQLQPLPLLLLHLLLVTRLLHATRCC